MQTKIIQPLWYHPTRVLLVDDDEKILKSLGKEIDPNFPFLAYTNPEEALEYLKKHTLPLEELSKAMILDIDPTEKRHLSTENVAIDFTPLHAHLDKDTRFTKIPVAIVDKVMKEMDGLDFCRAVKKFGLPVKLILLTGNAGEKEAVMAFNDGIIDAFIKKSVDMMTEVNHYLKTLSFQAFCDSSIELLGPISNRFSLLTDKNFAEFLKDRCKENKAVEYYIFDKSGSCLLITDTGKVKVILMKSPEDFQNAYDMVSDDKSINVKVSDALKKRSAFPFTGIHSYFTDDTEDWANAMVPMHKAEQLGSYYAVVDQPGGDVLSFDHYVNEIWKPKIV